MKQRVISGVIAGIIAVIALCLIHTPVYAVLISVIAAIAAYEIEHVAKVENKIIMGLSILFAFLVPMYFEYGATLAKVPVSIILIAYTIVLLILMLAKFGITRFEHVAIAVFASVFVPYSFSMLLLIRDIDETFAAGYTQKDSVYLVIFALLCSWITDIFAYFVGRKFGKRKLCPAISPKKTVEGAIGGVVCNVVFNLLVFFVFKKFINNTTNISYLFVTMMTILLSVAGMLGDLCASTIKRNYGAKDFGNIMPGHGGVMDRFDSCLFVLPTLYFVIYVINI